ncbi:MAG TPA: DNA lyase [Clostridiales bacterium UBA8153]|nr:DNA lyase [Clostridiales bacterium UBA8153]
MNRSEEETRARLGAVAQALHRAYVHEQALGTLLSAVEGDPLDMLILAMLSQATSDRHAQVAFSRLRARFPAWAQVLDASTEQIQDAIAFAGLGAQKARRIKEVLELLAGRGVLGLGWLRGYARGEAMAFLTGLPGVGPKTAACVLLFGFGHPAFPVDTHVARLCRRLGVAGPRERAGRIQERLERLVDPAQARRLHLTLIHHGRRVCRARRPACARCALASICAMGQESSGPAGKTTAPSGGERPT